MVFWLFKDPVRRESDRINAQIKKLRKLMAQTELKGCYSDREIREKEKALEEIHEQILQLEAAREKLWASTMKAKPRPKEEPPDLDN